MLYVSNGGTTVKLKGNQDMASSCYLTALKQPARIIPVEDLSRPTRKQKRAQRKAQAQKAKTEEEEEMKEISMEDLEYRPDDMPRPKPEGEIKQEMLADDPTRTVTIGMDMDTEVRVNLLTLLLETPTFSHSRRKRYQA